MIRHRSALHVSRRTGRTRRIIRIGVESLEGRALLSTVDTLGTIVPAIASIIADRGWNNDGNQSSLGLTNSSPDSTAMKPAQILAAYGFSTSSTAGAGTTIAIVDAYNDPNIKADLAAFDAYYGLPSASLKVLNQSGQSTNLPATDANWSLEIAMDVEWAHAVAPAAKIVLVEANSASISDLTTAVQTAARMSNVVSMSWGGGEFSGQQYFDSAAYFANPKVTFVAASGDDGGAYGAEWPASSPDVLAVGGTALSVTSSGAYGGETAWSASGSWWTGYSGSTGGVSRVESLPSYQATALGSNYASGRVVPDVSMDAAPSSGLSVFDSVAGLGQSGWFKVGGTSAGAPIWSGLVAGADQARAAAGLSPLSSTQTLNLLYSTYGSSATYAAGFHDVRTGVNFAGYATTGYDKVTGLGSPHAAWIIHEAAHPATSTVTTSTTTTQTVARVLFHAVRSNGETTSTTDQTTTATTASEIAVAATSVAALPASAANTAVAAPTSALTAATGAGTTLGQALPNQSLRTSNTAGGTRTLSGAMIQTVYEGSDFVPGATVDPMVVPGRGDFLTPPVLDPTTPIGVWDEALAGVHDEVDEGSAEPQAFVPWTAYEGAEEDLTEAAPSLLGAAGLAVVFWMSWNRRINEDDERRSGTFPTPSPSIN